MIRAVYCRSDDQLCSVRILPATSLPAVFELFHYANAVLPIFASESVIGLKITHTFVLDIIQCDRKCFSCCKHSKLIFSLRKGCIITCFYLRYGSSVGLADFARPMPHSSFLLHCATPFPTPQICPFP